MTGLLIYGLEEIWLDYTPHFSVSNFVINSTKMYAFQGDTQSEISKAKYRYNKNTHQEMKKSVLQDLWLKSIYPLISHKKSGFSILGSSTAGLGVVNFFLQLDRSFQLNLEVGNQQMQTFLHNNWRPQTKTPTQYWMDKLTFNKRSVIELLLSNCTWYTGSWFLNMDWLW